jgi:far upstream element-binding protein
VGIVIGRSGSNIRGVQERHMVKIQIPNHPDPGSMPEVRTVAISGNTAESVANAKADIDAILLTDFSSGEHRGSSRHNTQ